MILYKKKSHFIFRYLLGSIVLVLGLTFTVVDVYGLQLPFGHKAVDSYTNYLDKQIETKNAYAIDVEIIDIQTELYVRQTQGTDSIPASVPEPSTIILLASGLGLLRMAHRKK